MRVQQTYMLDKEGDVAGPISAVEKAASFAEKVLKTEWETVKFGEAAYREAVQATRHTLGGSFAVLAVLIIAIPVYYYWSASIEAPMLATKPMAPAASLPAPLPALTGK